MTTQDYAAMFRINQWMAQDVPIEYLKERISGMERDAIYEAVKQVGDDKWICIRPELVERRDIITGDYEYCVRVHVRPVEEARVYVYPVAYPASLIPKDLYRCDYCGGHTKNDMRGHCAACGGPRKEYTWDH